ncbi:MAG: hypothetical protein CMJ59_03535 [Planctomycetaceae bacterium]|nr:hypothetical protein [Planctomycetaceae bacterium]
MSSPTPSSETSPATATWPWLFSAPIDLAAFAGSALVSLLLLAWGASSGWLNADVPEWSWVTCILLIDVAHVYATGFRVYFDRQELQRRPWLYYGVPVVSYVLGLALYSEGELLFWRVLAYLAVFHFVRQQYGWVALYRAKAGEVGRAGRWIDNATIYAATLYPLIYWHAHLPRRFSWFVSHDFHVIPLVCEAVCWPLYCVALTLYAGKAMFQWVGGNPNPGKDLVVTTTAVCWYVGIVAFDSDYAFTVTNVIIHGVPYMVLVYWYWSRRVSDAADRGSTRWRGLVFFVATIWVLAYIEELIWHRAIWHDKEWLFGAGIGIEPIAQMLIVPMLATPQLTHYILDGFIWKRRSNPRFRL